MSKVEQLVRFAQAIANETPGFFETGGPGSGNRRTNDFMRKLRQCAEARFGYDYSEREICGSSQLAVDFFIPEEATIVEVAFSLRNSNTEFERDILKALMARESGHPVDLLLFLSKPGAINKHKQASSRAIIEWTERTHEIRIQIRELAS